MIESIIKRHLNRYDLIYRNNGFFVIIDYETKTIHNGLELFNSIFGYDYDDLYLERIEELKKEKFGNISNFLNNLTVKLGRTSWDVYNDESLITEKDISILFGGYGISEFNKWFDNKIIEESEKIMYNRF